MTACMSSAGRQIVEHALAEGRIVLMTVFDPGPPAPCRFSGPDFVRLTAAEIDVVTAPGTPEIMEGART